jgi:glucosamine-phosphate N-acetyltransferase
MTIELRYLEINDYNMGFMELLKQLTEVTDISYEFYETQFFELNNNTFIIVGVIDNKIVATGTIIIKSNFYRNCKNTGFIEDIVVSKNHRGKGYSTLIINKLKELAKKNNCYKIILDCKKEYYKFYKKFGFKKNKNLNLELRFYEENIKPPIPPCTTKTL